MCHYNLNHIFETEQTNPVRHSLNTRQLSRPLQYSRKSFVTFRWTLVALSTKHPIFLIFQNHFHPIVCVLTVTFFLILNLNGLSVLS